MFSFWLLKSSYVIFSGRPTPWTSCDNSLEGGSDTFPGCFCCVYDGSIYPIFLMYGTKILMVEKITFTIDLLANSFIILSIMYKPCKVAILLSGDVD